LLGAQLQPRVAAFAATLQKQLATGTLPDLIDLGAPRGYQCMPPAFSGFFGFGLYSEFLVTPGRVTINGEDGLIRRVALDQAQLPTELPASNAGTSIGHWDGQTLVVETAGLNPQNGGPFAVGQGARVVERISLTEPDTMEIVVTMTAPELLQAPFEKKMHYSRHRDHVFHEELTCVPGDRSIDPKTGRQRFDATPPADLPPPPVD
jgi:hypothetical protein